MPINIPNTLPASQTLRSENIFIIDENRATMQDIRPLEIAICNIMPTKIATETQLLRMLSNTPLQVNITFLYPVSHDTKNTSQAHLDTFYKTFDQIKDRKFDGFILTGAPIEKMKFEDVDYWPELQQIMDWSKSNVYTTLHLCWGAQAGLYHHYQVPKYQFERKISGIYTNSILDPLSPLFRGFDEEFNMPHSRYTEVSADDVSKVSAIKMLATSEEAGLTIVTSLDNRQLFFFGHAEYDKETLHNEYVRDRDKGLDIDPPQHYYLQDDPEKGCKLTWRSDASLLFANWLNYYVYQETPYNLDELK